MKKYILAVNVLPMFLGIAFSVVFLCTDVGAAEPQEKKAQFTFQTGHKPPYNLILDGRFKEAFARMGYSAEVVALPSQRSLVVSNSSGAGEAARVGNLVELAPANTTNLLKVPEVSLTLELNVFSRHHDFVVSGWDNLSPYTNGARIGAKILEKNIPGKRVFLADNSQLFKMLDNDRIDTVVEWKHAGLNVIKQLAIKNIKVLSPPMATIQFYPFIHKKHKDLIPIFTETLKQMKKDGAFHKIKEDIVGAN